jgi:hypothetical protein
MPELIDRRSLDRHTHVVSHESFKQSHDFPVSLTFKHYWVTRDEGMRTKEKMLRIFKKSIGASPQDERRHAQSPNVLLENEPTGRLFFGANDCASQTLFVKETLTDLSRAMTFFLHYSSPTRSAHRRQK